jgi:RNA polymerase sigma factor (TIGR02999 family)
MKVATFSVWLTWFYRLFLSTGFAFLIDLCANEDEKVEGRWLNFTSTLRKARMDSSEVTRLLVDWNSGNPDAFNKLAPLVYDELHRLAQSYRNRERPDLTLQATAIVHEAYLRLIDADKISWRNRAHFFAISARVMRRVLVDHARSRNYLKRGGEAPHVSFEQTDVASPEPNSDLAALEDALQLLAKVDQRKADVIELRFFGGLSVEETAEVLKVSTDTVKRDWRLAKSWLLRELTQTASWRVSQNETSPPQTANSPPGGGAGICRRR